MRLRIFLVMVVLFSWTSQADDPPAREGTKTQLSASEIADLKQWVENAKHDLSILQDEHERGSLEERRSSLTRDFEAIVGRSGKKENELLMRYVLNRALEISEIVGPTPDPSELQSLVSFLDATIELSKGFYTDDQKYLEAIGKGVAAELQTPMDVFAYKYTELLLGFSRTFLRPELEYRITYKALGWLGNDLNSSRNLSRVQHSEVIVRIGRLQAKFPEEPAGASHEILKSIRKFKWEYRERVSQLLRSTSTAIQAEMGRNNAAAPATHSVVPKDKVREAEVDSFEGSGKVGSYVMETDGYYTIRKIKAISADNQYLLDDGVWYGAEHVHRLISSYRGIQVGQKIVETNGYRSIQKVIHISEKGYFHLSDGNFYPFTEISAVETE
jgi:hypothetical protein